jgi:hypothetical protein
MTKIDLALAIFTACNAFRVLAYVPQIIRVLHDEHGASAISYTTWSLFAASHISTVLYATVALGDLTMAVVFAVNAGCCAAIIVLTAYKRRIFASNDPDNRSSLPDAGHARRRASRLPLTQSRECSPALTRH